MRTKAAGAAIPARRPSLISGLALVGGLAVGTLIIGWSGFGRVTAATLSVGWSGFATLALYQLSLFGVLGLAWATIMPNPALLPMVTWSRMVREAATNCMPFAVIGGFLAGARALVAGGIPWPLALGSSIVDMTAEFFGQIVLIALGVILLLVRFHGNQLALPAGIALAAAVPAAACFVWLQLGADRVFRLLGHRIAADWFSDASVRMDLLQAELRRLYSRFGRLVLATAIHLVAWIATGLGTWLAYRLLGAKIDLAAALTIEALLQILLSVGFLVPGAIGVQEVGYASIGAMFGLPPELSLGVSLLRRARDIALGVPILLLWQFVEARRVIRA